MFLINLYNCFKPKGTPVGFITIKYNFIQPGIYHHFHDLLLSKSFFQARTKPIQSISTHGIEGFISVRR
jgi:hypothetical protein